MADQKYRLEPHKVIVVSEIPACNFCEDGTPGPYDFATKFGPWGNGCEMHWKLYRAAPDLGTGKGQLWVTQDQVDPVDAVDAALKQEQRRRALEDLRVAVESGRMDDAEFEYQSRALKLTEDEIEGMFQ